MSTASDFHCRSATRLLAAGLALVSLALTPPARGAIQPAPGFAAGSGLAQEDASPGLKESAAVTLRRVRLRLEPVRHADPTACAALTLADLAVSLRGQRLSAEALVDLDRRQGPSLHALLIDTSASMVGKLGFVRAAAAEYVRRLRPGLDRALVATFDEDVILQHGATADHAAILSSLERVRMGNATSLHDGLYYLIDELRTHTERPVVVLLTDGVDTGSLHERDDVNALAESRADLVVFSIGYQLPDIQAGRPGVSSARRFLYNLSRRTGGEFFDVPTASRLDLAYRRIHTMLAGEAFLTVNDPDPGAAGGRIQVRSTRAECEVTVFRGDPEEKPRSSATAVADSEPKRLPLLPGAPVRQRLGLPGSEVIPDSCAPADGETLPEAAWFVRAGTAGLTGCALDVAMDGGMLYSTLDVTRWDVNRWIDLRTRPIEIDLPAPADLPGSPVDLLDRIAGQVMLRGEDPEATSPLKRPARDHARPFADLPWLVNGRTLLDTRSQIARAMFLLPRYAGWARAALERDAERELAALVAGLRELAPGMAPADLDRIARTSPAGRRILRRAREATGDDLRPYLAAWLGDVPAHDLFSAWEVRHANLLLAAEASVDPGAFPRAWGALRRVFFVPSYARILALLAPVHDSEAERIGFWRVVLPRVSWFQPRVRDAARHPEHADLPMDLIPDAPLGYHALQAQLAGAPGLRRRLRDYRVTAVGYALQGKPFRHDPPRAFREARVTVRLESRRVAEALTLIVDAGIDPASRAISIDRCHWVGSASAGLPACVPSVSRLH